MSLEDQVQTIIDAAANKAEKLIQAAVRQRMKETPRPGGFLFAMGSPFWIDSDGENVERGDMPGTEDIENACDSYLDSFGTMTWRIDWIRGKLVERTKW